jgi:hypothetical protein
MGASEDEKEPDFGRAKINWAKTNWNAPLACDCGGGKRGDDSLRVHRVLIGVDALESPMKRLIAMITFAATGPAFAVPGGELDTLPRGLFVCELPGDANGSVGQLVPEADFAISNDSTYQTDLGYGAYLVTGDQVTMTSGPLRGDRFRRVSDRFLRKLDAAGKETRLRCVLQHANSER